MLQYKSVYPQTLELLKHLMSLPELRDFYLVGGTALALQIGHRISVDLDFFTEKDFSPEDLKTNLDQIFSVTSFFAEQNTLSLIIAFPPNTENAIKVDFIKYKYPLLKPPFVENGLRLASIEDIIPMKLSAIAGRGSKKDFYDLYFLLQSYSLAEMIDLFKRKFQIANVFHLTKSLVYFDDAEVEPEPILIKPANWTEVKKTITKAVMEYLGR